MREFEAAESDPASVAGPASFRVYTPEELKSVPLRPSHRPSRALQATGSSGPVAFQAVLKWLGVGIGVGGLLLAILFAIGVMTDDTRNLANARKADAVSGDSHANDAKSTKKANGTKVLPNVLPNTRAVLAPSPALVTTPVPTDFELPSEPPPPPRAAIGRADKKKGTGKRPIVRTAPY